MPPVNRHRPPSRSTRGGSTPWIRFNSPLQLAFAILAVSMVICMVASSCLSPF